MRADAWRAPVRDVPSSRAARLDVLLDAYDAGARPPGSGREARNTLEFAEALYEAAFTGRPVRSGEIVPGGPFHAVMRGGRTGWVPGGRV